MELKLSKTALKVLESRYLIKKENEVVETPIQMFERVSKNIAEADTLYNESKEKAYDIFLNLLTSMNFLPNSPTIMNACIRLQYLSASFVLPIGDLLEFIFITL